MMTSFNVESKLTPINPRRLAQTPQMQTSRRDSNDNWTGASHTGPAAVVSQRISNGAIAWPKLWNKITSGIRYYLKSNPIMANIASAHLGEANSEIQRPNAQLIYGQALSSPSTHYSHR
jgi:hypothetical protein